MNKYLALIIILFCTILSCKDQTVSVVQYPIIAAHQDVKNLKLTEADLKDWFLKDIELDTIPGLSISRINQSTIETLFSKKSKVIIAVIDSDIDINHDYLKNYIWINESEIPNNGIDDDSNGFVDDRNGWNFLCNQDGENSIYFSYEFVRILKRHAFLEANLSVSELDSLSKDADYNKSYARAKEAYEVQLKEATEEKSNAISMDQNNSNAKEWLSTIFENTIYNARDLDSLKPMYANNEKYTLLLTVKSNFLTYNFSDEVIAKNLERSVEKVDKLLNLDYNDRLQIRDDENNLSDSDYGCGDVTSNAKLLNHGTTVAGAIVSVLEPVVNQVKDNASFKIMPLAISAVGDENDKDIALAIRYAVDNGADIINMSSSKSFSLHKDWVQDAITYADKNGVLVITSAGNDGESLDDPDIFNYPNDINNDNTEFTSNFIKIGASGYSLDNSLKRKSSNYGVRDVDMFAPGSQIYTSSTNSERYEFSSGTSMAAPITSGVAGLLKLAYPELTPSQIKDILLKSGTQYDIPIVLKVKNNDTISKPFRELSKSGKIVNAYNALIFVKKTKTRYFHTPRIGSFINADIDLPTHL